MNACKLGLSVMALLLAASSASAGIVSFTNEATFLAANPGLLAEDFSGPTTVFSNPYFGPGNQWAFGALGGDSFLRSSGLLRTTPGGSNVAVFFATGIEAVGLRLFSAAPVGNAPFEIVTVDRAGNTLLTILTVLPQSTAFIGVTSPDDILSMTVSYLPNPAIIRFDHLYFSAGGGGNVFPTTIPLPHGAAAGFVGLALAAIAARQRKRSCRA